MLQIIRKLLIVSLISAVTLTTMSATHVAAIITTLHISMQSTVTHRFGTHPNLAVDDTFRFEVTLYGAATVGNPEELNNFLWCDPEATCTYRLWKVTDATWTATYKRGETLIHTQGGTLGSILGAHSSEEIDDFNMERGELLFLDKNDQTIIRYRNFNGNYTPDMRDFQNFVFQIHASNFFDLNFFDQPRPEWFTYQYDYLKAQKHALVAVTTFFSSTLNYDANSESGIIESQRAAVDSLVTISPVSPTRVGYTFTGWNTAPTGTGTSYQPGATFTMPASGTTTLYAQWSLDVVSSPIVDTPTTLDPPASPAPEQQPPALTRNTPTLKVKKSLTQVKLLKLSDTRVRRKDSITLRVAKASQKKCGLEGTRLRALGRGKCTVMITIKKKPTRSIPSPRPVRNQITLQII